jgi:hypothetical protein
VVSFLSTGGPHTERGTCQSTSDGGNVLHFVYRANVKAILIWEEAMSELASFGTFAALPEEQLSEKIAAASSPAAKG